MRTSTVPILLSNVDHFKDFRIKKKNFFFLDEKENNALYERYIST